MGPPSFSCSTSCTGPRLPLEDKQRLAETLAPAKQSKRNKRTSQQGRDIGAAAQDRGNTQHPHVWRLLV